MSFRYILSPSGGLAYHLIARRRSRSSWRAFRAVVRDWLSSWLGETDQELIVFGPSAGWTLPLEDFNRFSQIIFVEPDPVARWLLTRRLAKAGVRGKHLKFIERSDLLPWLAKDPSAFGDFLRQYPRAAILFANVLGQIGLHLSREQKTTTTQGRDVFLQALSGRRWASYHDLFSGPAGAQNGLTTDAVSQMPDNLAETVFAEGTIIDHETTWLSKDRRTLLALWPLTENTVHIIGFIQNEGPWADSKE